MAAKEFQVKGCRLAAASAGIRYSDRRDLCLVELAPGSSVAGVFTRNRFCAAPVTLARQHLAAGEVRYLLINSGNANAGTGAEGMQAALTCCQLVAKSAGCDASQVLPFSTGVIGEPLPIAPFETSVPQLMQGLVGNAWPDAARAIMTTDTLPKLTQRQVRWGSKEISLVGMAKGSGMIHPNMATMLGYIVCDARVSRELACRWNSELAEISFNRATVDGDTSTNDACILAFTGGADRETIESEDDRRAQPLYQALKSIYLELAQALVRDGEGATKFVTLRVRGGRSQQECKQVAFAVAHSPLVKTAFFASDPNWGRILAAVGNAGLDDLDTDQVNIDLDQLALVRHGQRAAGYSEQAGQEVFNQPEFTVVIDLGRGSEDTEVWTSDLSHQYVTINAEYRT